MNKITESQKKKLLRLARIADTGELGIIKEINDLEDKVDEALNLAKGDKGNEGTPGKDGYTPIKNVDYFDGKNGKDGKDSIVPGPMGPAGKDGESVIGPSGKDGKDGSPDTGEQVRDKLESLTDENRLDISAIKGSEKIIEDIKKSGKSINMGWGAHPLTIQQSGALKAKNIRFLNFTGATVSVSSAGVVTVAITDTGITQLTGDVTAGPGNGSQAATLASIITAGGPIGSATVAPIITYDVKGRLTAVSSATITPAVGSITGLGTGVATALAVNVGTAGAFVVNGGALGTPSSGTATNLSGTASSLTAGAVTNATFTTALTVNTGTLTLTANAANTSVLTIGAGAVSVSGANTGDQTITLTGAVTGGGTGTFATTIATPGTLTVATSNSTATAHTHAITSSSAPGAAASLLATDSSGIIGSTGTRIVKIWATDLTVTNNIAGSITGNAATVTTNANLTGVITSSGNATSIASQTGTGTKFVVDTAPTIVGGLHTAITTLGIRDTSAAFDVTLAATSSTTLTGGRTLTIDVVNAARTLKLTGNPTIADWFDQSVKSTAAVTFASVNGTGVLNSAIDIIQGSSAAIRFRAGASVAGTPFFQLWGNDSTIGQAGQVLFDCGTAGGAAVLFRGGSGPTTIMTLVGASNNVKLTGTAVRGGTEGTNHLDIFDGTAPSGTLSNGISLYSTAGELRVMDSGGTATLLSSHSRKTGEWIHDSYNVISHKRLIVQAERMAKFIDEKFGTHFVEEIYDNLTTI